MICTNWDCIQCIIMKVQYIRLPDAKKMKWKKTFSLITFKKENTCTWNWYKTFCVCSGPFSNSWSGMKKRCARRVAGKVVWSTSTSASVVCASKRSSQTASAAYVTTAGRECASDVEDLPRAAGTRRKRR